MRFKYAHPALEPDAMPAFPEYFCDAIEYLYDDITGDYDYDLFLSPNRRKRTKFPALGEYYKTPSRENARALLVSLRLPVPYASLIQSAAPSAPVVAPKEPRTSDRQKYKYFADPNISRHGPPKKSFAIFQPIEPPGLFNAHRMISLIYDLLHRWLTPKIYTRLNRITNAPTDVTDALFELSEAADYCNQNIIWIKPRLAKIAEALAGLSSPRAQTLTFKPNRPNTANSMDRYLYAKVRGWYARPSLEIVLDGLFRDVSFPRVKSIKANDTKRVNWAVNDSEIARSLTLCAYLQLLISDWDSVQPGKSCPGIQTKQILFLIGDFQSQKSKGINFFFSQWVSHIRAETACISHLPPSAIGARKIAVSDMPPLADTRFANVAVNPSGLSVKLPDRPNVTGDAMLRAIQQGTFVPYRRKRAKLTDRSRDGSCDGAKLSLTDRYLPKFSTSNPKSWLQAVFNRYRDENELTPETEVFIETLAVVNAFRDAIRAEVALARGAVYITIDALALVYYQARADRMAGASKKSNGLMIHPAGPENLAIRYYVPAAAVAQRAAPLGA